ncbi:hypothetical protein MMC07_005148 [Pseudocyphellaria aurata]|nr:hypothetical protein [Pseudocyphellaria aurata]
MEQLEIHSKSYLVRWVNVKAEHTISWSIQPHKKSINFGIFKHPGSGKAPTPRLPSSTFEPPPTPGLGPRLGEDVSTSRNASSTATEKLKSIGLKPISWYGTCEAHRVSTGKYDVVKNEGGMYALVFDNTFSKSFSKAVTFVLLTYPTSSPPQANHHMHHIQGSSTGSNQSVRDVHSPRIVLARHESSDSITPNDRSTPDLPISSTEARTQRLGESESSIGSNFFTGVLHKRRRKKHQGYARRFFSLDYASSTLSYYHDRNTLALRGAVPLSLAAIGANAATRQISIDSGAEIWHLKAANQKDFEAWRDALELARSSFSPTSPDSLTRVDTRNRRHSAPRVNPEEEREWVKVEDLANRVRKSRDDARSLAKDTDPKYFPLQAPKAVFDKPLEIPSRSAASSMSESPTDGNANGYFNEVERRPFWKRKQSGEKTMPGGFRRSVSAQSTVSSSRNTLPSPTAGVTQGPENQALRSQPEETLHDHCMSLLRDLESVVADFTALIAESKERRGPVPLSAASRHSMDSQGSQEFFDAEGSTSQLLDIHQESDDEGGKTDQDLAGDSASESDVEGSGNLDRSKATTQTATSAFPTKPKSLAPLPARPVKRRRAVPPPAVNPPSLIGFLRKNVGKDLSTISMPVSANEPLSLLQRASEQLEYSTLLDEAATSATTSADRLLFVSAFAISYMSSSRVKERAIRKPFNPMLGESYELVREDRGFRFLAEKISHRPVRMACQGESENWTFTQSPMPTQKFWGKSAELVTEGRVRVVLHSTGDRFSWSPATSFLRNIIAGEKYIEPVNTMTINNEATGEHALVTFKTGGMFSGRSEDVVVQTFGSHGDELSVGLVGKWTASLTVTEHGTPKSEPPIWSVAELVPDVSKRYGLTTFAASLNEITPLERGRLAPTDSRLRPDQRAMEEGDFGKAEEWKARLEEGQRARRKGLEERGEDWVPRWFGKVSGGEGDEVWVAIGGREGYWEERERGGWEGLDNVLDA